MTPTNIQISNSNPFLHSAVPPRRVISLVPSITESIFELDLGEYLVGITDYCSEPKGKLDNITRVGGVKDSSLEKITSLNPDLVIASKDENSRELLEQVGDKGIPVWVTHPKTIEDALDIINGIAGIFRNDPASLKIHVLKTAIEYASMAVADNPPIRFFCPLWQEERDQQIHWITFNDDTYSGDLLKRCGGTNIFADRKRRYPLDADLNTTFPEEDAGDRDTGYPRVTIEEVEKAQPELILFPDEPLDFSDDAITKSMMYLKNTPAGKSQHFLKIDGKMISWFGTRTAKAVLEVPGYFV